MAITLTNGAAVKEVGTDMQANALVTLGWTIVSGTAGATVTALGTLPYFHESMTGNFNPAFRGTGLDGEKGVVGALAKPLEAEMTLDELQFMQDNLNYSDALGTMTAISIVTSLPAAAQSATTIYLLTVQDSTVAPGAYKWNVTDTAFEAF